MTAVDQPVPCTLKLAAGTQTILVDGWASSLALRIYPTPDGFASLLALPGVTLAEGFKTLKEAHHFNQLLLAHRKIYVGSPDMEEFYQSAGGHAAAEREIDKLKTRTRAAMTRSTPKKEVKK